MKATLASLLALTLAACTTPRVLPGDGATDMPATLDASEDATVDAEPSDFGTDDSIPDAGAPDLFMCVAVAGACASAAECCDTTLDCQTTGSSPSQPVCCGLGRHPCVGGGGGSDCCGSLDCQSNSEGYVCCGYIGEPCFDPMGRDCCGILGCNATTHLCF